MWNALFGSSDDVKEEVKPKEEVESTTPADQLTATATTPTIAAPADADRIVSTTSSSGVHQSAAISSKLYRNRRVFKVIIVGNAGVGKTCLSFRFCNGRFPAHTEATIGVDFRERCVQIDGESIRVQLWDTAGQERFRQSMVAHYYRNVNAVVFVYDLTNRQSYDDMHYWIDECRKNALAGSGDRDSTPHIIIGNKCDLAGAATTGVKTDEAQMFADRNDMPLFETSALADSEADHVESIFMTLVHKLKEAKPMHVQSEQERVVRNDDDRRRLLLRAGEHLDGDQSTWCC